jgi:hypothetical protein
MSVDRVDPPAGARGETGARLADGVDRVGVDPVVPFGAAHLVGGVDEKRLVEIVQNAPKMVGMPWVKMTSVMSSGVRPSVERVDQAARAGLERQGPRRSRTGSCDRPAAEA